MAQKYTLYIDESGESGIEKIRSQNHTGASPYMTLGACLVPNSHQEIITVKLQKVAEDIKKITLHCKEMNHRQKVYYSRSIQSEKFLGFGVISLKSTLGRYKSDIQSNSDFYHNKCAQYLLERIGYFMKEKQISPQDLTIIFEHSNNDISTLRNLINKCQKYPIDSRVALLNYIDTSKILTRKKKERPLLQLADLIAHSLYSCVNKSRSNLHIPEGRYLYELRKRFFHNTNTRRIEGYGIKAVHNLKSLQLDPDIHQLIDSLSAETEALS